MDEERDEKDPTLDVLFPEREIKLASGATEVIRPWGIKTGMRLMPRVLELGGRLQGDLSDVALADLITKATPEVLDIIRHTLGWTEQEAEDRLSYEDIFTLGQAIVEVCIIRVDGGGAVGKLLGLGGSLLAGKGATSPEPSST